MTLDTHSWDTLAHNSARLAQSALQAMADEIDLAGAPAGDGPVDLDAEPVIDLDAMDWSAMDGVGIEAPPAPDPQLAHTAAAALLDQLPGNLPPLTGTLDTAGFSAWLALYRAGHDGLHRLVALVQSTNDS